MNKFLKYTLITAGILLLLAFLWSCRTKKLGNGGIISQTQIKRIDTSKTAPDYMKISTTTGKCDCLKHMGFVYLPDPAHPPDTFCYYKKTNFLDCPTPTPPAPRPSGTIHKR